MERGWTVGDPERQEQLRLMCGRKESCSRCEEWSVRKMGRSEEEAVNECGRCVVAFVKGQEKDLSVADL